jgi:hypothetical protein
MRATTVRALAFLGWLILSTTDARAEGPHTAGTRVNNLKVLSDKVDDVTTVENVLKSFVKPGMSDRERARAIWTATVKYRHQAPPPDECLAADWEAHDPVKVFNVYGYCMCCCSTALIAALNRADGREARGRILDGHSVPEVRYGDAWHMYDASLIARFPRPGDGVDASVDEIREAVAAWYAAHPGYRGEPAKLARLMSRDGWTGWKTEGPELLAGCPYYTRGYFPAGTHGWDDTMAEYARSPSEVYEYGYHAGHRALFSLRPGESLTREAGNRGLHVNRERSPRWDGLKARAPEKDLAYLKDLFPGYRGGIVGNGVQRYAPDLASGGLAGGADVYDNLAAGTPALHPKAGGRPGVAIIPMASPYVYLGGKVRLKAVRRSAGDTVTLSISTDNARSFAPLWAADATGRSEAVVDLTGKILRRYAYWLKVELSSAAPEGAGAGAGAGLESLVVENDVQHAPRTLPQLGRGRNTITVAADGDPGVASRAIACRITPDTSFTKNETTGTMGVTFENLDLKDGACWWKGGVGRMTVPIELPGDLVALRFSAQIRARGAKDLVAMLVSTDGGLTWREAARMAGPTPGRTGQFLCGDWPPGTRNALLRFEMTGNNTVGVLSFRADADYKDPRAAGGFRPFHVVHRWTEDGLEKMHDQTVPTLPFTYTIDAAADPELTSVTYEMTSAQ